MSATTTTTRGRWASWRRWPGSCRLPAFLVGVRCPVEVIMARRDAGSGGRGVHGGYVTSAPDGTVPDIVVRWERAVHDPGIYDLEVDTSTASPEACAAAVLRRVDEGPPVAFAELADDDSGHSPGETTERLLSPRGPPHRPGPGRRWPRCRDCRNYEAGNCTCSAWASNEALSALRMYPEAIALSRLFVYSRCSCSGCRRGWRAGPGVKATVDPKRPADRVGAGGRCAAEGGDRDVDRWCPDASDHVAVRIEGQRRRMRARQREGWRARGRRAVVDPLVEGGECRLDHVVLGAAVHGRGAAEDARGSAHGVGVGVRRCRRSPRCGSCRCWAAAPGRSRAE